MARNEKVKNALLGKIKRRIGKAPYDALLVESASAILYLTGFQCPGSKLLVKKKGESVYFIDPMNYSLACRQLKGLNLEKIHSGPVLRSLKEHCIKNGIKKIGLNKKSMIVGELEALASSRFSLLDSGEVIAGLRVLKAEREIKILRKAAKETVKIWKEATRKIRHGMTELEVAGLIDILIKENGFDNSFPTIAASGKNSAYPHALPGKSKFKPGELLLVDFGIRYKGYCSDLTRTYYKGRIDRQIREFREIVLRAHDYAIDKLKPGVSIGSLSSGVNNIFNSNGFGKFVLHGLGHGVGVDVHEYPFLRLNSTERFRKGMVVTIEPGLYSEGLGGVREENMVLLTSKGCEVLSA